MLLGAEAHRMLLASILDVGAPLAQPLPQAGLIRVCIRLDELTLEKPAGGRAGARRKEGGEGRGLLEGI